MPGILYINCDNRISTRVRNTDTGEWVNDATVTVTLRNAAGSEVSGGNVWPATMSYKAGSDGLYQAVFQNGLSLTANAKYTATIDADGDSLQVQQLPIFTAKYLR